MTKAAGEKENERWCQLGGLVMIVGTGYVRVSVRKAQVSCDGVLEKVNWMSLPSTVVNLNRSKLQLPAGTD